MPVKSSPVTAADIAERQRLGLDDRDEEWEGVYHVTPPPSSNHQDVQAVLIRFLLELIEHRGGGRALPGVGVFRESPAGPDYRIPDVAFVAAGNEGIVTKDGIRGGAPDAVVEILSPHDESYEKFGFYAAIGVPEVVIIEPEGRTVEVWRLSGGKYRKARRDGGGRVEARSMEVWFETVVGKTKRLRMVDRRESGRKMEV